MERHPDDSNFPAMGEIDSLLVDLGIVETCGPEAVLLLAAAGGDSHSTMVVLDVPN